MSDTPEPIHPGLYRVGDAGIRLVAGICDRCDAPHFPRTDTCPFCGGAETTERLVGPAGVVVLCTVVHRAPPGYAGPVPYGFGVVRIGGTRLEIVTRLRASRLDALLPGSRVTLAIDHLPGPDGTPAAVWTFEAVPG